MPLSEPFGFLNYPNTMEFTGGKIEPVPDFEKVHAYINESTNKDGFYYPPQIKTVVFDPIKTEPIEDVSNTDRPAAVFSLPPSHVLYIDNPLTQENIRKEDAGLLIHLLGFFFGTRLQFADWRFDGKVPIKSVNNFTSFDNASSFISHVYQEWKVWNPEARKCFINILYMHGKASSCEWAWDEFIYRYMVFDAIYKFYSLLVDKRANSHKERVVFLCKKFSIPYPKKDDEDIVAKIVKLRNDLFHEALWDSATPGLQDSEAYLAAKWLGKLNARLITAVSGYNNKYSKSPWWFFGWEYFDKFSR